MPKIRVLVVDDAVVFRRLVAEELSADPAIEVVGTARDGAEGIERVQELQPDVVTFDLNMPVVDGLSFVREQMRLQPLPIVIISIAANAG